MVIVDYLFQFIESLEERFLGRLPGLRPNSLAEVLEHELMIGRGVALCDTST